jgi:hypothetical protein
MKPTSNDRTIISGMVSHVRLGHLPPRIEILWDGERAYVIKDETRIPFLGLTRQSLARLHASALVLRAEGGGQTEVVSLTPKAYQVVDTDFEEYGALSVWTLDRRLTVISLVVALSALALSILK